MSSTHETPKEGKMPSDYLELIAMSRRFTPAEFFFLAQHGIFQDDERLELLEGLIITMSIRKPEHDCGVLYSDAALRPHCKAEYYLRIHMTIEMKDSVCVPECAIVRGPCKKHAHAFPKSDETELVVEVSDTTLTCDRGIKARIYARAGIPTYWILNLEGRQLEVLSDPTGDVEQPGYRKNQVYKDSDKAVLALGGQAVGEIAVADLLP
jgi:Uma2 family endonuclease